MKDGKYRYGHRPGRRRRTRILIVLTVSLLIIGIVGGLISYDMYKSRSKPVSGTGRTIIQTLDETTNRLVVNEPTFTMELPGDWKEAARRNDVNERSITWQATKKNADNRMLKLHIDLIPPTRAVNRLLPVAAEGPGLVLGDLSENCSMFTQGGAGATGQAPTSKEAPAKWQRVDFICNLPRAIDNEVGTGSTGLVNTINVTGPSQGAHKYFFVYTDRNIQPDYTILFNALKTFRAK